MKKALVLAFLAFDCSAADALTGSFQLSTLHPDQVASTSQAISKITVLISAYRCDAASEGKKDARCAKANATKKVLERFGVSKIPFEDLNFALATEGETITASAISVANYIEQVQPEYAGMSARDITLDTAPMFLYVWGD